ncbi:MAG TPA: hypothetical protein VFJ85_09850 [Acidimicrobiales bacterium]|nr:hypothetical protein [Acidimicrobiales bacterium]
MFEPVGGDPDSLLRLAGALDAAAAELRRLQVRAAWGAGATGVPSEAAALAARVQVWLASEAGDLRRRARILAEDRRYLFDPNQKFGMASQRGRNRLRLTDEAAQVERLNAVIRDPAATEAAKDAASEQLRTLEKENDDRRNRQSRDAKPPPKSPKATRKAQGRQEGRSSEEGDAERGSGGDAGGGG